MSQPVPYSRDAEKGVLSAILIAPDAVMDVCERRAVIPEWFLVPAHTEIFRCVREVNSASKAIDFITLAQVLSDKGKLDYCGGGPYLNELFVYLPTAANVSYYIDVIESKYHLRQAIEFASEVMNRAGSGEDSESVMEMMESRCMAIRSSRYKTSMPSMKAIAMQAVGDIQALYENRGKITGIETGFRELDELTNGAHSEEMTIIAARPSVGKTALAMNIAEHMSLSGVVVVFFSGEMSSRQIGIRSLCSAARVNARNIQRGLLADRDFPALSAAAAKMAASNMIIDDTSSPSIEYIRGVCRRTRRLNPDKKIVVFIDYAGLCTTSDERAKATRQLELGAVSRGAKGISKEISCAVYLLSQLNRESSKQQRRPRLTDLRESGDLEQDADNVLLLHRPEMEMDADGEEIEKVRGLAEIILAKQRNGSVGDIIPLTFFKEFTRFEDRAIEGNT